ncbi:MAG: hypothetical protein WDZ45_09175 [Flavobacteriaceae bacterium]
MNNHPEHKNQSEEIDLGYLFKKINQFFKSVVIILFHVIAFFLKYKYVVLGLIIIGVAYGYYKDATSEPILNNEVIVIPNFESVDYLYDKVEALNAKIEAEDTLYLKTILGSNHRKLRKIEIEPIVDIYNFAAQSRENIDVFRILFQNQELAEFVEDITTSKYYKYHRINFIIKGEEQSSLIVENLLAYFNDNNHFREYQEIHLENTGYLLEQNAKTIEQIDSIFQAVISYSQRVGGSQSVNINDNSDLGTLVFRKQEVLKERIQLLKQEKDGVQVIKSVTVNYNLILDEGLNLSNKVKFPILFVLLFSMIFFLRFLYKNLELIAKSN